MTIPGEIWVALLGVVVACLQALALKLQRKTQQELRVPTERHNGTGEKKTADNSIGMADFARIILDEVDVIHGRLNGVDERLAGKADKPGFVDPGPVTKPRIAAGGAGG